ncbi:DUF6196 family protein [Nonomuraea candida]|uniref:DUF6196 family protein n=1 Tax=Nonomuraea candida TaxID=359159 RepID=UPI000B12E42E|nr:DUF6196 family protein [Nonomuraea candida]
MWDDAADSPDPSVAEHVRRYLATDGRDGYLEGGVTNLVLTVKGRKLGRWLRTGLFFGEDDGRYVLVASGSAITHTHPGCVSRETPEQTHERLRQVITMADLAVHEGVWCFEEFPADRPPELTADTLAVVRDSESWSRLVPLRDGGADVERFGIFSFHFPAGLDNSGFVGWLAGHLKAELGTGVFVICGSNRARGGIYDYWGCPIDLVEEAVAIVRSLRLA